MTQTRAKKCGSLQLPRSNLPYYGQSVGIIMLDTANLDAATAEVVEGEQLALEGFTRVPGDVGNATSFSFSVQYKLLENLAIDDVIAQQPTAKGEAAMVQAARELEREGVRSIATTCGLFSWFQPLLSSAVDIPVFSSALLQVPMLSNTIGKHRKVGIITANSDILTPEHLARVGIDQSVPHVLWGTQERPAEENIWVFDELDPARRTLRLEQALELTAERMLGSHPDIGAIVLECTNMPPGAHKIQQRTGLPVFDVITMIEWAHLGGVRKAYSGYM